MHTDCFVCTQCKGKLAGMNFRSKNGGNYCDNCYTEKFQPKCSKCAKVIGLNVKYSKYKNKCYHPECFACSKCKKSIQGEQFNELEGQFTCVNCR
ncbi:hypothetical protein AAHC03_09540 [Spirometra sp. Aus1]